MSSAWYVLHTYSGHENRVKLTLEQRILERQMQEKLNQVLVPTQEVAEIKNGKRKVSSKISFPGYVFVKMELDDELWYIVKNTPGVMGFVGMGNEPTPLGDEEVEDILKATEEGPSEEYKQAIDIAVGDKAKIVDGPFTGFSGVVDEINEDKSKLKLMISIFGRSTPVELEFFQIEKI
ncbi:transcription termination/antitermination factor NusG [Candidatus Poribacteria bacterium]|nr:transcription termination/antitermination factor NusG [Candidatus Poribacteria bacterium]